MAEELLPSSAAPEEEPASLYEAAAELPADFASANGNGPSQQAYEVEIDSRHEAIHDATGDLAPAAVNARPLSTEAAPSAGQATASPIGSPHDAGESPDMLRWRAEMLLDEMMVGAVDASAGDQGAFFRQAPPLSRAEWIVDEPPRAPADAPPAPARPPAANGNNAHDLPAHGVRRRAPTPLPAKGAQGASRSNGTATPNGAASANGTPAPNAAHDAHPSSNAGQSVGIVGVDYINGAVARAEPPATNGFVLSNGVRGGGEASAQPVAQGAQEEEPMRAPVQRPENSAQDEPPIPPAPFRPPPSVVARNAARPDAPSQPSQPVRNAPAQSGAYPIASTDPYSPEALAPVDFAPDGSQSAFAEAAPKAPKAPNQPAGRTALAESYAAAPQTQPVAAAPVREASRKLTAVEQRYPNSNRSQNAARATGSHADLYNVDDDVPELGPVRRNPAVINRGTVTGSMEVGSRNSRYAALLPRSTPWDLHEMEREIAALSDEMVRVLPPGHESARRAHHLLDKAQSIFVAEPQRSAEVDYYLAQVRAIVDRSRQTLQWAGLYRKRLVMYLMAWAILSAVVVAATLIFGSALGARAGSAFGWAAEGWAVNNLGPALLAIYGGALGGALGGLANLQRYLAHGVGFIDRKFSLRGLILPVMGMVAGALLFGMVAGFFRLFGIPLNSSWLLELVPALLAFGLGFAQESIYGTRE